VFLIDAKDNRLGKAISLFEELSKVMRNRVRASAKCDDALEILSLVFVVRDRPTEAVNFVSARPPTRSVPLRDDAMDAVGRKESIVDALP